MTDFIWKVTSISAYPTYDNKQDVVSTVTWTLTAVSGDHNAVQVGSTNLDLSNLLDYIPYDQLTENQVIIWVQDLLGQDSINVLESELQIEIDNQINPLIVPIVMPLPW